MRFQLQKELSALSAEKVSEASELRAELRIKSFELTSLGVAFEVRHSKFICLRRRVICCSHSADSTYM